MSFLKKYIWQIIAGILLIFIIGLTVKVINSQPVIVDNKEREYLLNKVEQDSLLIEEMAVNIRRLSDIAEAKPKEIVKIKIKYEKIKDSVVSLPIDGKVSLLADYLHNK